MTIPTLVIHGDDDQIVPFETCGKVAAQLLPDGELKVYQGGSHGIWPTHKHQINRGFARFYSRIIYRRLTPPNHQLPALSMINCLPQFPG